MSKKLNVGGNNNTLLKYFSRSPATDKKKIPGFPSNEKPLLANGKENVKSGQEIQENTVKEQDGNAAKVSDQEASRKRQRIELEEPEEESENNDSSLFEGADSDDYKPSEDEESDSSGVSEAESSIESPENESSDDENGSRKNLKRPKQRSGSNDNEPKKKKIKLDEAISGDTFLEKLNKLKESSDGFVEDKNINENIMNVVTNSFDEPTVWPHQRLDFLQPDKIRDKNKRRPDHPDYDPNTLFVPDSYMDKLSPGLRQWWQLKSENFQCILFFKVGKFYEFYHMDADIGVQELGFTYMKGDFAHSGFPEVSYDKMSSILIARGYKVARVEQTETPEMMQARFKNSKPSKVEKYRNDKVVRREICQISSLGTQVFGSQCQITPNYQPNYMLGIVEKDEGTYSRYGICFIDTSIGDFYLREFDDDSSSSRLLTVLSHHTPILVLYEKNSLSERTQQIMRSTLSTVVKESWPNVGVKACSAEKTLKYLAEGYYSTTEEAKDWPLVLKAMHSKSDHLGLTPDENYCLVLKALGLCISLIHQCRLAEKVLPMARYHLYNPPDIEAESVSKMDLSKIIAKHRQQLLVLDSMTITNLRIVGDDFSLFATLDNCCTKFGKRLLHHWLCAPSCNVDEIAERSSAIAYLLREKKMEQIRCLLATLPDFERYLAQIHLFGNKNVLDKHPDGRAVMFEEKLYNRKKIKNFISTLEGFKIMLEISSFFKNSESPLLKRITQIPSNGGIFPDMEELLNFFENSFDHELADKTGIIAPHKGVDADFDECEHKIETINQGLKDYLIEQEKFFGCRLKYYGTDKKRFQLEVPESYAKKATAEYSLEGKKQGKTPIRRYVTDATKEFLKQMMAAEEEKNILLKDISRRIFEKFSSNYDTWKQAIDCVAYLDVLCSLTEYAHQQPTLCIPKVSDFSEKPFIHIEEGYHPCAKSDGYIPNGIELGTSCVPALSLLTGPNMGGKSTLMRQVACLIIMAQIGAHVPAKRCDFSLFDRIFTRLGAHDDILAGQSTFLVELNETSSILKHATMHSLVLLDELGRGTATYDGTAIAASVVKFLANLKCRTLFSTHYHNLIDFFENDERITLGHMACMVENDESDDPTQETVTFLYKYTPGACPKSYGFNAAKLAGIPRSIIKRAYELSKQVEAFALKKKIAASVIGKMTGSEDYKLLKHMIKQLKKCQS